MVAYCYTRVSSFEQFTNGHSLDAQARACLTYCQRFNLPLGTATNADVPGVIVDGGKSAFKKPLEYRPGGKLLLMNLRRGDTVVATCINRLFRRMQDAVHVLEHWLDRGINVVFTDYPSLNFTTANGKAILYVLSTMAQLKSELSGARVREALAAAKLRKGEKVKKQKKDVVPSGEHLLGKDVSAILQQMEVAPAGRSGRLLGYVRVSTAEQSIEQQKMIIANSAQGEVTWYEDVDVSAFKVPLSKRASGSRLLRDLQPGDTILILRPDRMFRSLHDMAIQVDAIHKAGAFIQIVESGIRSDDPFSKLMLSLLSVMAEIESAEIGRATKHGQMAACLVSERARQWRIPTFLKPQKKLRDSDAFSFIEVMSCEEKYRMWTLFIETRDDYSTRKAAARAVSNMALIEMGLPVVIGEESELVGSYLKKVIKMQEDTFSLRRQRTIEILEKLPKKSLVRHPINVVSLGRVEPLTRRFLKAAEFVPGSWRDRNALAALAASCPQPEQVIQTLTSIGG